MSHLQAQSPRTITEVKATSDESSLLLEEDLQLLPFQVDSTIHIIVFLKGSLTQQEQDRSSIINWELIELNVLQYHIFLTQ